MFAAVAFPPRPAVGRSLSAATGLTLVEVMVSMAVLVLTTVGGVSGFMIFNQYAASSRNISSAKALCQERIEEVQTMIFTPPTVVPTVTGQLDGANYFPLGPGSNSVTAAGSSVATVYNATTGAYTGTSPLVTSAVTASAGESVRVYVQQDGVTNTVLGTRTTTVSLASLVDASPSATGSLGVMAFTVTVNYTYRGKNYTYSMYTLRSPD